MILLGKKSRRKFKSKENIQKVIEEEKNNYTRPKPSFNGKKYTSYLVIFALIVSAVFLVRYVNSLPGKHDSFAQCVVDSGSKMYSAWWCSHCREQKALFGKSFKIIEKGGAHVECSPDGTQTFSQYCIDQGVQGTPTWMSADGEFLGNRMSLEELSSKTNCPLN